MIRTKPTLPPGSATTSFAGSKAGVTFDAGLGHDTVLGSKHADLFQGGEGNDTLSGKKGDDTLQGGAGLDAVTGGTGSDTFVFASGDLITSRSSSNSHKGRVDTITDFQGAGTNGVAAQDVIHLEGFGAGTTLKYVAKDGGAQVYEVVDPTTPGRDGFISVRLDKHPDTRLTPDDVVVVPPPGPQITITNITEGGDGFSYLASISGDGSRVTFQSDATNLVDGEVDLNGPRPDIFVYDLATDRMVNITQAGNSGSYNPSISADGSTVAFLSNASNLVDGEVDQYGQVGIFLYDVATGQTVSITQGASADVYYYPYIGLSADGSTAVFTSSATNLVDGQVDLNEQNDIFLYDVATGETVNLTYGADGHSYHASLATDGSRVAFWSFATNLVDGEIDQNGARTDIFVRDVATGKTVNVTNGQNASSTDASLSADGSTVAFQSYSTNLVDGQVDQNSAPDIFIYNVATGKTVNVTHGGDGDSFHFSLSADGSKVAFSSRATNLVDGQVDHNGSGVDIFVYDVATGETVNVTQGRSGESFFPTISADGLTGTFYGPAESSETDGTTDVFVWELG